MVYTLLKMVNLEWFTIALPTLYIYIYIYTIGYGYEYITTAGQHPQLLVVLPIHASQE